MDTLEKSNTTLEMLIISSHQLEKQLLEANVEQGPLWVFHIREILYDLVRVNQQLADILMNKTNVDEVPLELQAFIEDFLYGVIPHLKSHAIELEKDVDEYVNQEETEQLSYVVETLQGVVN